MGCLLSPETSKKNCLILVSPKDLDVFVFICLFFIVGGVVVFCVFPFSKLLVDSVG